MKFDRHKYWKHNAMIDVFFCVSKVSFDDDGKKAVLKGTWCTQGVEGWWFTVPDRLMIRPPHYERWEKYYPKGKPRL